MKLKRRKYTKKSRKTIKRKYTKKSRKTIKRRYTKKSRKTIKRRYTNKRYTGGTGEDPYLSAVDEEESELNEDPYLSAVDEEESELNEAQRAAETMAKQKTDTSAPGHMTAWLNHDIVCSNYDKVSCEEDTRCYYVDYWSATGSDKGCKNKYSFPEWEGMVGIPRPPPTTSVKPSAVTPSAVTPSAFTPSAVTPSAVTPSAVTQDQKLQEYDLLQQEIKDLKKELGLAN